MAGAAPYEAKTARALTAIGAVRSLGRPGLVARPNARFTAADPDGRSAVYAARGADAHGRSPPNPVQAATRPQASRRSVGGRASRRSARACTGTRPTE